jgi:hypothetical protein
MNDKEDFPAKFRAGCRELPVKFSLGSQGFTAKMPKRKKTPNTSKMPLDKALTKGNRGRPGVRASEVVGRADNYRGMFWTNRLRGRKGNKQWVRDKPHEWAAALVAAKTTNDAVRAIDSAPLPIQNELRLLVPLILQVLRDSDLPKRQENQFDFLADSLAARGEVSPRRSRDICQEERLKAERAHHIISYEFTIECSCGFKGFSKDHGCPKCGAKIALGLSFIYGGRLF